MYKVLLIGYSAGGLKPALTILKQLPCDFPVPILVVGHSTAEGTQLTPDLIGQSIKLTAWLAYDKQTISAGNVYIAPPNYHLLMESDNQLALSVDEPECYVRPSIDVLFETACDATNGKLLAVQLSGSNQDGSRGLAYIHKHHGTTFVQSPDSAEFTTMVEAALEIMTPDYIATPKDIAAILSGIGKA